VSAESLEPNGLPRAGRYRARTRLVALTAPTEPAKPVPPPADSDPVDFDPVDFDRVDFDPVGSDRVDADRADLGRVSADRAGALGAQGTAGRLVQRWLPAPARDARWDPGRPGARALSAVAALAAVLAAIGVWWDRPVPEPVPALPVLPAAAPAAAEGAGPGVTVPEPATELVVSVMGRVVRPGVVRVPDGARVADALDAAGGPLPETDLTALNLARRLGDGEQLLVGIAPPPGVPADGGTAGALAPGGGAAAQSGGTSAVDLNTATLEQLDTLPGVGPVTAQRILDWRTANGRFTAIEQLREVDGIGEARYAKLKDLVRV
jgi:comEA protein